MSSPVVITGIGSVTPAGISAPALLDRIRTGAPVAAPPSTFDPTGFSCPVAAEVRDFHPASSLDEAKAIRLMSREAQFAVAASQLALRDAQFGPSPPYPPEAIGLFAATGMAGLPFQEIASLLRASLNPAGQFDLHEFGRAGLRAISPLLSFKLLPNMPACFASIRAGLQGPNSIYTPWEGQGAQAIAAAVRALRRGSADCALAGGSDGKCHELAFITLQQLGLFASWNRFGAGSVPGEGSVFLVLETAAAARARGAHIYAAISHMNFASRTRADPRKTTFLRAIKPVLTARQRSAAASATLFVLARDGDDALTEDEDAALDAAGVSPEDPLAPKQIVGNLFAAAAALQMAVAASSVEQSHRPALVHCFGCGTEQAVFLLEPP